MDGCWGHDGGWLLVVQVGGDDGAMGAVVGGH